MWWVGAVKWIRHTDKRLNINEEAVSLTSPLSAALSSPTDRSSHNSTVSPITDHLSAKQNGYDIFWTLLSAQLELCDKSSKGQSVAHWASPWTGLRNEEKRSGHRDISEAVTSSANARGCVKQLFLRWTAKCCWTRPLLVERNCELLFKKALKLQKLSGTDEKVHQHVTRVKQQLNLTTAFLRVSQSQNWAINDIKAPFQKP